ncbi:hypothetical protein E4U53_006862 [Claviceps sorghi]|nr:hypothetical protein E4U53_006862 [Claviceps sorghi]
MAGKLQLLAITAAINGGGAPHPKVESLVHGSGGDGRDGGQKKSNNAPVTPMSGENARFGPSSEHAGFEEPAGISRLRHSL